MNTGWAKFGIFVFGAITFYVIAGLASGNWNIFKNAKSSIKPDGTPCTTSDGQAGVITNGACTTSGGPKPTDTTETRIISTNNVQKSFLENLSNGIVSK